MSTAGASGSRTQSMCAPTRAKIATIPIGISVMAASVSVDSPPLSKASLVEPDPAPCEVRGLPFALSSHYSVHAIALEVLFDIRIDGLCRLDIRARRLFVALLRVRDPSSIERARILLLQLEHRRVIRNCVVQFPHFQVDQATAVERVGIARTHRQRAIAIFKRLFEVTDHGARPAATVPSPDRLRIELDDFAVVFDRTGGIAEGVVTEGASVEGVGGAGIEFDRPVEVLDGARVVPFALIALPSRHVRGRISRVQLDRPVAILDRAIEVPLSVQGQAAVGERKIVFGIERDRAVEVANCPIAVTDFLVKDAPIVESNLVARISLDDDAVILDCTVVFAFGAKREGSTEEAADRLRVESDHLIVILIA